MADSGKGILLKLRTVFVGEEWITDPGGSTSPIWKDGILKYRNSDKFEYITWSEGVHNGSLEKINLFPGGQIKDFYHKKEVLNMVDVKLKIIRENSIKNPHGFSKLSHTII